MTLEFILSYPQFIGFDGEGDEAEAAAAKAAAAKAAEEAAAAAAAKGGKTYTEEEFNAHMGGLRRKYETQAEALKASQKEQAAQLEKLTKVKGLSDEERTALETKIAGLESQYMTDKEKAERKAREDAQKYNTSLETLTGDRDRWRSDFQDEVVRNQIAQAAEKNQAHRASQIEAIVRPWIEFEEIRTEDGELTGKVHAVVNFPDVDKEKKPITMKYTVDEAVTRMTEIEEHHNLFSDKQKPGLGGGKNATGSGKKIDASKLAKENPAEYRRLRKESPELLYGS